MENTEQVETLRQDLLAFVKKRLAGDDLVETEKYILSGLEELLSVSRDVVLEEMTMALKVIKALYRNSFPDN